MTILLGGWISLGLGMGCGIYDPAFSTLDRLYGAEAQAAITTLTLWGGFASTVSWPLSAFILDHGGWRVERVNYAALQVAVALPLILLLISSLPATLSVAKNNPSAAINLATRERQAFLLLAYVLILGGAVMSLFSAHVLTLLPGGVVPLARTVTFGALIGPSQVTARVIEIVGKGRHHPLWTLTPAMGLVAVGSGLLALDLPVITLAVIL